MSSTLLIPVPRLWGASCMVWEHRGGVTKTNSTCGQACARPSAKRSQPKETCTRTWRGASGIELRPWGGRVWCQQPLPNLTPPQWGIASMRGQSCVHKAWRITRGSPVHVRASCAGVFGDFISSGRSAAAGVFEFRGFSFKRSLRSSRVE